MFTGIVEEVGKIRQITNKNIEVECVKILEDIKQGDSISVNGVCLTVTEFAKDFFKADVSQETFRASILDSLKTGDFVNLERAMKCDGRFGGHIVSGHIDGCAKCINLVKNSEFYVINFKLDDEQIRYVVKKGSICINGISLTIANIDNSEIELAIIPHTFQNTNLKYLKIGQFVNIEVDIISKYIEKFLLTSDNSSRISLSFLQENGF